MLLQEIINYQVAITLLEIKTRFNQVEFKKLQDIDNINDYASKTLKKLGEGTSRIAYLLSNRYVLKIANPKAIEKGIGQNKSEVDVATNPKTQAVVAQVYDVGPNYKWIISELARPITDEWEFKNLTGVEWDFFSYLILNHRTAEEKIENEILEKEKAIKTWTRRGKKDKVAQLKQVIQDIKRAKQSTIVLGSLALIKNSGVMPGDIEIIDHWAKTPDGRVVLIDYGFTKDLVHLYTDNDS